MGITSTDSGIIVIGAAIIYENKILLVENGGRLVLPGGKVEQGESDLECLCREVREELSGTRIKNIRPYKSFFGITPNNGNILMLHTYFADIEGELNGPSAEITGYKWVDDPRRHRLSDITSQIVKALVRDRYLREPEI